MSFGQMSKALEEDKDGRLADAVALEENGKPTAKGKGFLFEDDLTAAIDVALTLGRPLLVAGEPGCGKTELGYAIARRLNVSQLHLAIVKSTSEAGDLFYTYDALRRFREAQLDQLKAADAGERAPSDIGDFINFQAMGIAIIDAHERDAIKHLLRGKSVRYREDKKEGWRSVVVIDEIDKAPRDFPNDLLHEIESLSFRIKEFPSDPPPEAPSRDLLTRDRCPIVIITSNEERQLPDAFLRRCVFHEMAFPEGDRLQAIVRKGLCNRLARMGWTGDPDPTLGEDRVKQLVDLLTQFRDRGPEKKPGIAEMLDAAALLFVAGTDAPISITRPAIAKVKSDRGLFDTLAQ